MNKKLPLFRHFFTLVLFLNINIYSQDSTANKNHLTQPETLTDSLLTETGDSTETVHINLDSAAVDSTKAAKDTVTKAVNDTTKPKDKEKKLDPPNRPRNINNHAFEVGEKLKFKIRFGFIRAGTAEMKVLSKKQKEKRMVYHIQTTAKSVSAFNWMYKVDDVVNTYLDSEGLYPIRFEKKLREGGYKADLFVDYFPEKTTAKVEYIRYEKNMKEKSRKNFSVETPKYVQDVLSAFYFIRNMDIEVGKSIFMSNHDKDKIYDLEVKVYEKEIIEVEAGRFRCIVVEPMMKGEGLFKQKGSLKIWLTDDDRKIPVQMTSEILVGHITTELIKIEGVKGEIKAKLD
ncbi:MAG: DUF3108 domain-containing protein [Calditrichaceae bacterium]